MCMQNLLEETRKDLARHGLTEADVVWVGTCDGAAAISWAKFTELADKTYDAGYGAVCVELSLVVVGIDWWLERSEYDGSEGWVFKRLPQLATEITDLKEIFD